MKAVLVTSPCQSEPDLWFSVKKEDIEKTVEICSTCPLKDTCLRNAEENGEIHGVWGGKNFNTGALAKGNPSGLCKNERHDLPEGGRCKKCASEKKKRYNADLKARGIKRHTPGRWKKNFIGGKCHNGHELTINNTKVRDHDKALMCTQCIRRVAPKITRSENKGYYR